MDDSRNFMGERDWCYEQCRRRCTGTLHIIEKGDTLYNLGKRYNVSVSAIMRANPFINIYNLHINDTICIPVMPTRPANEIPEDIEFGFAEEEFGNNMSAEEIGGLDEKDISSSENTTFFSENDSVKEMLEKAGMTMDELLDCINRRR